MGSNIVADSLKSPVEVVEYLYRRLYQVGIRYVFGVPGDYNLVALDSLEKCGLQWVGNVNELNAAYAADGYARIKGISALITTYGVGELSALNGIAGAFSEFVPVLHIVGTPSTISQANGMLLHHTLGNGDFSVFRHMSSSISCAVARLEDSLQAAYLIDHAIRECYVRSRPAYITLPTDMVSKKVEGDRLKTPIDLEFEPNDKEQEDFVVEDVLKNIRAAKSPVILVDACAIRHRALKEVHNLVVTSGLPTFVAPMGKGAVDETLPNFYGVYAGDGSNPGVRELVESSDMVLSIGAIKSDFNTAGFSYRTSQLSSIDFHSTFVKVRYSEYTGVQMHGVLDKVTKKLGKMSTPALEKPRRLVAEDDNANGEAITHAWLWPQLGEFVKQDDIIITETGTSGYGIWEVLFQKGTSAINQILWGSIGYATGSCQGAALAGKELGNRRTVLFTGDGSIQLTVQELSTMIRQKLCPIIFVICNEGFTIERFIHGMDATYNDIAPWKFQDLIPTFGAEQGTYKTYQVKTKQDVLKLIADDDFANAAKLRLVELYMPKKDAPAPLKLTAEASAKNNSRQ